MRGLRREEENSNVRKPASGGRTSRLCGTRQVPVAQHPIVHPRLPRDTGRKRGAQARARGGSEARRRAEQRICMSELRPLSLPPITPLALSELQHLSRSHFRTLTLSFSQSLILSLSCSRALALSRSLCGSLCLPFTLTDALPQSPSVLPNSDRTQKTEAQPTFGDLSAPAWSRRRRGTAAPRRALMHGRGHRASAAAPPPPPSLPTCDSPPWRPPQSAPTRPPDSRFPRIHLRRLHLWRA